ncbi:4625_t:CDS:2, partial [Dentiscutata heterogama]
MSFYYFLGLLSTNWLTLWKSKLRWLKRVHVGQLMGITNYRPSCSEITSFAEHELFNVWSVNYAEHEVFEHCGGVSYAGW